MARPRLPQEKAEVAGANVVHPARFKDRKAPKGRAIGDPYKTMTEAQAEVWNECREEMPWLKASHRILLRQACILAARMNTDTEFGVSAMQALSSIMSKLGATPTDETKVNYDDGESDDPADQYFTRSH
jgi:hypothetical protein